MMTNFKKSFAVAIALILSSGFYATPSLAQENTKQIAENEEWNLKFELQKCQRKLKIVNCSFLMIKQEDITGTYKDRGFYMFANDDGVSRVIAPDGEEYPAKLIQSGEKKGKYIVVNPIKGVPLRVNLSFELPPQVTNLSALAVNFKLQADIAPRKEVVFRDINISN